MVSARSPGTRTTEPRRCAGANDNRERSLRRSSRVRGCAAVLLSNSARRANALVDEYRRELRIRRDVASAPPWGRAKTCDQEIDECSRFRRNEASASIDRKNRQRVELRGREHSDESAIRKIRGGIVQRQDDDPGSGDCRAPESLGVVGDDRAGNRDHEARRADAKPPLHVGGQLRETKTRVSAQVIRCPRLPMCTEVARRRADYFRRRRKSTSDETRDLETSSVGAIRMATSTRSETKSTMGFTTESSTRTDG